MSDASEVSESPSGDEAQDVEAEGGRLHSLIASASTRAKAEQERMAALLERHKDRPLLELTLRTYQRDREVAGTLVGSAIAFRLFLFFVPLLLFVIGVAGLLSNWVESEDVLEETAVSGGMSEQIRYAFEQPGGTSWVAILFGFFGMATAGRTLSKVMMAASALAWRQPVTFKASVRVIGAFIGLVAGVGLLAAGVNRVRDEFGVGVTSVSFLAVFGLYTVAWIGIGTLLPRATADPSALVPGAVLVAATTAGMQVISQLYLPGKLGRASQLYGAIGTTIVTLGWFFILGRAIVLAMSINAIVYERYGSISQFVFGLPVLRILPRRSAWIRRFFGLDETEREIPPPAEPAD
jgi:uncharacterized BrkB/YihY/UPF0761 family membrane protein